MLEFARALRKVIEQLRADTDNGPSTNAPLSAPPLTNKSGAEGSVRNSSYGLSRRRWFKLAGAATGGIAFTSVHEIAGALTPEVDPLLGIDALYDPDTTTLVLQHVKTSNAIGGDPISALQEALSTIETEALTPTALRKNIGVGLNALRTPSAKEALLKHKGVRALLSQQWESNPAFRDAVLPLSGTEAQVAIRPFASLSASEQTAAVESFYLPQVEFVAEGEEAFGAINTYIDLTAPGRSLTADLLRKGLSLSGPELEAFAASREVLVARKLVTSIRSLRDNTIGSPKYESAREEVNGLVNELEQQGLSPGEEIDTVLKQHRLYYKLAALSPLEVLSLYVKNNDSELFLFNDGLMIRSPTNTEKYLSSRIEMIIRDLAGGKRHWTIPQGSTADEIRSIIITGNSLSE